MGKVLGRLAIPAVKWFFQVWMACLAELVQWMSGGMYWWVVHWDSMNSSTSFYVSLSILCNCGLKPRLDRYLYVIWQARRSSSLVWFLMGTDAMKLAS